MKSYRSIITEKALAIASARDEKTLQQAIFNCGGVDGIAEILQKMRKEHESPISATAAGVYHAPAKENHSPFRPSGISNLAWLRENLPYAIANLIAVELGKHHISLQDFLKMPGTVIKHMLDMWFSRPESHGITKSISDKVESVGGNHGN